jgi:hypothetical protein
MKIKQSQLKRLIEAATLRRLRKHTIQENTMKIKKSQLESLIEAVVVEVLNEAYKSPEWGGILGEPNGPDSGTSDDEGAPLRTAVASFRQVAHTNPYIPNQIKASRIAGHRARGYDQANAEARKNIGALEGLTEIARLKRMIEAVVVEVLNGRQAST